MTLDDVREWARKKTNGGEELPKDAPPEDGYWFGAVAFVDGFDAVEVDDEFAEVAAGSQPVAYRVDFYPGEWGWFTATFKFAGEMPA